VARTVLEEGPVTAAQIARHLGLTPAAVRRHLDGLLEAGLVRVREPLTQTSPRGRGRPARRYLLTDAGHAELTTAYDDLAASAMAYLAEQLGPQAVRGFAERRVAELEGRYAPVIRAAGTDLAARTRALADALTQDGYAASARPVATPHGDGGEQLCQGHCPVQQVAERFPQLCDAETEVFSRLLGVHVQRLATLAGGAHVCTTHIPNPHIPNPLTAATTRAQTAEPAHPEGRTTR
jgi:predicted ArsR family transcriptional regulator